MDNTNKNPIFSLKNFRSFGEDGADFELAPITVLTGCNSAGKSSLVKALMLLSDKPNYRYGDTIKYSQYLKTSSKQLNLGGYKSIVNKDGNVTMSYRIWSSDIHDYLVVTRKFCSKSNDVLNEGVLNHLTVERTDGRLVYQAGPGWLDGLYLPDEIRSDSVETEFNIFYAVGLFFQCKYFYERAQEIVENDKKNSLFDKNYVEKALDEALLSLKTIGLTEQDAYRLWKELDQEIWDAICEIKTKFDAEIGRAQKIAADIPNYYESLKMPNHIEALKKEKEESMMNVFAKHVIGKATSPYFTQNSIYIDSASAQIARIYPAEGENKICKAMRGFNDGRIGYQDTVQIYVCEHYAIKEPGSFINKWLSIFGIGDSIEITGTDEGLGLMMYLNNGKTKRLLADEGYGITQLVSLLLQIDNSIPSFQEAEEKKYIGKESFVFNYQPKIICVEEPEVHLHPKFQSLLADMFVEAYQKYNIHFIIETHSEYLIRKLQVMVADKDNPLKPNDVSLNYVEKDEEGVSHNRQIKIKDDGGLSDSFGKGFYDEADSLALELMKYKARKK